MIIICNAGENYRSGAVNTLFVSSIEITPIGSRSAVQFITMSDRVYTVVEFADYDEAMEKVKELSEKIWGNEQEIIEANNLELSVM